MFNTPGFKEKNASGGFNLNTNKSVDDRRGNQGISFREESPVVVSDANKTKKNLLQFGVYYDGDAKQAKEGSELGTGQKSRRSIKQKLEYLLNNGGKRREPAAPAVVGGIENMIQNYKKYMGGVHIDAALDQLIKKKQRVNF